MGTRPGGNRRQAWGATAALVVAAAIALFAFRPPAQPAAEEDGPTRAGTGSSAPAPVRTPTDEQFCSEFLLMAYSQGQFVGGSDGAGAADLRSAARSLVETGVPDAMSLPARSGYFTMMSGVYDSVGLELSPSDVGAPEQPAEGSDAAFSAYLARFCPP